jgi:hypothetical protein
MCHHGAITSFGSVILRAVAMGESEPRVRLVVCPMEAAVPAIPVPKASARR